MPFENLDIVVGRPIDLDLDAVWAKVVERRRGGFCYELNGLLGALLRTVGFDVALVEGRRWVDGRPAGRYQHGRLVVDIGSQRWLVDVGNGASALAPLPLGPTGSEELVDDGPTRRRVLRPAPTDTDTGWRTEVDVGDGWESDWWSDDTPRSLGDFADACRAHETSEDSHFTQGLICTMPTPKGRITLSTHELIITERGRRTTRPIDDVRIPLADVFGIVVPDWDGVVRPAPFSNSY